MATRQINHDVNVELVRLVADTETQAVQRAINTAIAAGTKKKIVLPKSYALPSPVTLDGLAGVVIEGGGSDLCAITAAANMGTAFDASGDVTDITFRGVGFVGNLIDDVTGPRRSRTSTGTGFTTAVRLIGDLAPTSYLSADASIGDSTLQLVSSISAGTYRLGSEVVTVTGVTGSSAPYTAALSTNLTATHAAATDFVSPNRSIRNVRFEHVRCQNISQLPLRVSGVRGNVELDNYRVENCLDTGFTFNDAVLVDHFVSRKSADNGISLSRGNRRVVVDNYDIDGACYAGIWIAGFSQDTGAQRVTIGSGVITNSGTHGIQGSQAPQYLSITGALIDGVRRGPTDAPDADAGFGIYLTGYPYLSGSPTTYAREFSIADVVLKDCSRGGIALAGVKQGVIHGALIMRPGSQYLADGTTAVTTSMPDQNFGISVLPAQSTTVSNIDVQGVAVIDDRGTPYANNPIYGTGATAWTQSNNVAYGCRLALTESPTSIARTFGATTLFNALATFTAGIKVGASGASGTLSRISAGINTNKYLRFESADLPRWAVRVTNETETGSAAGANWELQAYDDTGTLLSTPLRVERATGHMTFEQPQGYGFPCTVDPGMIRAADTMALPANGALYARVREGGTITKIGVHVGTSSGDISVAAYANTGAGRSGVPGTQLATSGAVPCPTSGVYTEIPLGASVTLHPGDWLALSADNATATFRSLLSGVADSQLGLGRQFRQATAHPLPATPSTLVATIGNDIVLIGV